MKTRELYVLIRRELASTILHTIIDLVTAVY